ncbi:hypothetical protein BKA80DRAFT_776 [Phyllosticta citrichinensis]
MRPFYLLLALLPVALAVPAPQDGPVRDTQCTCPPPECPQQEPAGCECRQKAVLDCSDQKQAAGLNCPIPALAACPKQPDTNNPALPPTRKEKPPPAVKPNPNFKCPCEESFCIQSYPESCECANRNARECYDNCGGPEPVYDVSALRRPGVVVLLFALGGGGGGRGRWLVDKPWGMLR